METVNLANSSTTSKRRELDFYPTPPDVTHALMRFLDFRPIKIWEPACGDGAMGDVLKMYAHDVICTDLRVTGYGEGGIDFLTERRDCDAIITNPPFNLSEDFIRHALTQAGTVAMVLKSQYWHAKKRSALFQEFPPAYVLPLTWRPDFLFNTRQPGDKVGPTMEVHWTVWMAGRTDTRYQILGRDV